jgi:hypothetical protein
VIVPSILKRASIFKKLSTQIIGNQRSAVVRTIVVLRGDLSKSVFSTVVKVAIHKHHQKDLKQKKCFASELYAAVFTCTFSPDR